MKITLFILVFVATSTHASEVGRFQLITHPVSPNRTLLIDSSTGKVWERSCYKQREGNSAICDLEAWAPMEIIGINSDIKKIAKSARAMESRESQGAGDGYGKDAPPPQ